MGNFREDLDILSNLTFIYNHHDFILGHMVKKILKKVTSFSSLPIMNRDKYISLYNYSIYPLSGGISLLVTIT